jgi:hypothetical protein
MEGEMIQGRRDDIGRKRWYLEKEMISGGRDNTGRKRWYKEEEIIQGEMIQGGRDDTGRKICYWEEEMIYLFSWSRVSCRVCPASLPALSEIRNGDQRWQHPQSQPPPPRPSLASLRFSAHITETWARKSFISVTSPSPSPRNHGAALNKFIG